MSASVHAGIHPLGADTPPGADPPGTDTPRSRHPPGADIPQEQTPPGSRHPPREQTPPPPGEADCSIRSTSGRYASYWNAFLFIYNFSFDHRNAEGDPVKPGGLMRLGSSGRQMNNAAIQLSGGSMTSSIGNSMGLSGTD